MKSLPWAAFLLSTALHVCGPAPLVAQALGLDEVVASALETHPALVSALARLDGSEAGVATARARRLPTVGLDASLTRFEEPMIVAPLHRFDPTAPPRFDETLVQGRLGLTYTLFDGGIRGSGMDGAQALAEAAAHGAEAVRAELIQQAVEAYYAVAAARAVHDAAESRAQALADELDRARRRFDAGTAPRVAVLRADASLQEARAQLASATSSVGLAERSLARLSGLDSRSIEGRPLDARALADPDGGGNDPLVDRARGAVAAAEARVGEARGARLPRLDLGAGLLDFGTPSGEHVLEWQAGLQLSWAAFTGGSRRAAVRRAEAELREARAELARTELASEGAADAARFAVIDADARVEALRSAVDQWAEVARIEALALETGAGIQGDLLRAEAGLFQARAGLARARADAATARVHLARALGTLTPQWLITASEAFR